MKKIMFNDKFMLTKAVLEERKTQTRRIVKTSDAFERVNPDFDWDEEDIKNWENDFVSRVNNMTETEKNECFNYLLNHPRYKVGEVVAVAQSYKDVDAFYNAAFYRKHSVHGMTVTMLDCVPDEEIKKWFAIRKQFANKASWNNKMFSESTLMPHQILITDVRMERLQDISDEDCLKEGIEEINMSLEQEEYRYCFYDNTKELWAKYITPREAFARLINKVSRKGVWEENPYVFVYDFELVK